MKKEVYVCWHESDTTGEIDRYDLLLVPEDAEDIRSMDNLIVSYPVTRSAAGSVLVSTAMLHKLAEIQNQGYPIRFFF